ncbi:MAG TPA: 5-formyltetrahydrofolate cyclo-ligase [Candidatus Hydrogenedentes bacterium]|nr:5-formyltetrahydrofolate cyclo-ligase [Candidatus Hydrogenedentota bacterium]
MPILVRMLGKRELRKRVLAVRRAMAPAEVAERSRAIADALTRLDVFCSAQTVLSYIASKDNEVDTKPLVERLLAEGRIVLVPVADGRGGLAWSRLLALSELAPARFGILEPTPEFERRVEPPHQAPVLVPGIAFTRNGFRIGYGGGYYDRFLANHPGPKLGLAFERQIIGCFDIDPHDVPLDAIITEAAVYARQGTAG